MMDGAPINRTADTDALVERMARAQVLDEALRRAAPDDADTLIAGYLHQRAGQCTPRTGFTDVAVSTIISDAEMWAAAAPRVEVAAYVRAGLQELAASALAPAMRKALIAALWKGLSADDKRTFIARVAGQ